MPVDRVFMAHGKAARIAELFVFCFHALGDFWHIGNEVGAKPYRIGRAGLALLRRSLGGRAARIREQYANRQHKPADKTHGLHHALFSLPSECVKIPEGGTLKHGDEKWKSEFDRDGSR